MEDMTAELADRVRVALADRDDVSERRMMGGIVFMVSGHMCCGADRHGLLVRVGPEQFEAALDEPDARVMDLTGRPMHGFVLVPETLTDARLAAWVDRGVAHATSLPPKRRGERVA
jgi:hypothetical protein